MAASSTSEETSCRFSTSRHGEHGMQHEVVCDLSNGDNTKDRVWSTTALPNFENR